MKAQDFLMTVLAIHVGIFTAGIVLDEGGKGTFGGSVKNLSDKITSGFGTV